MLSSLEHVVPLSTQSSVTEDLSAKHHTAGKDDEKEGVVPTQSRGEVEW